MTPERYCVVHDSAEDPGGRGRVCLRWLRDESVPETEVCQFVGAECRRCGDPISGRTENGRCGRCNHEVMG